MFYHIEGVVSDIEPNLVVLDCGGVGFALNTSTNSIAQIKQGERIKLYVTESIGESNFDLFGFPTKSEKRCFEMLTSVSGIGPKAAISILSYNTPESLAMAIINDDAKALTVAPGIGKKIAQRVILELKDKFGKEFGTTVTSLPAITAVVSADDRKIQDAINALVVLGYSNAEINSAVRKIDTSSMNVEQIIKAVLKNMI